MNETKLFRKDFTMVVIGQIISLFGNSILRYALPLYLLNQTHSASLFGIVTACSFLPMLLLSPVGGIVADRVNKRNVMVILDFSTAGLILLFSLTMHTFNLIGLLIAVLMILYGIQGAYQPTVQASIPLLVSGNNLMPANAIINLVNSISGLIGPVLGGVLFGFYGLTPILYISIFCFVLSAVMEIFITIPFKKEPQSEGIIKLAKHDMKLSFQFIHENPILLRVCLLIASINLVFSALLIIGIPIIINEHLGFSQSVGNQLYGYAEGALAAGGLIGGLLTGVIGKKLSVQKSHGILALCTLSLLPIGIALVLPISSMAVYLIIVISCTCMMVLSTLFSIEMITYAQMVTPANLLGKVMALMSVIIMCAHPLGQLIYGVLFELLKANISIIFFAALIVCSGITLAGRSIIRSIPPISDCTRHVHS
ncbi:MAG: MFS transporter [Clostridia bacterium]|nr:MFS transporter [Clostridia bacterium]